MAFRIPARMILPLLLLMTWGHAAAAQDIGGPAGLENLSPRLVQGILAGLALVIACLGARHGLKSDARHRSQAVFHPVSEVKLAVMSVFTLNLYAFFWMYRHWRWLKSVEGEDILPIVRALFSSLFLFPAFLSANERLDNRKVPTWIGATAAILFFAYSTVSAFPALTSRTVQVAVFALTPATMLVFLPTLVAVNRLNDRTSAAYIANSRINVWNLAGIALGLALYCLIGLRLYR